MKAIKTVRTVFDVIMVLFAVFCIGVFAFIKITGMEILVVQSGSMEPTINVDDIVIIQPIKIPDVKVDDIITYEDKDTLVTHRVTAVQDTDRGITLTMKGDNNNIEDKTKVTDKNIVGKYITHFSKVADFYYFIKSPFGIITIVGVPLLIYMILSLIIYIKTPEEEKIKVEDITEADDLKDNKKEE